MTFQIDEFTFTGIDESRLKTPYRVTHNADGYVRTIGVLRLSETAITLEPESAHGAIPSQEQIDRFADAWVAEARARRVKAYAQRRADECCAFINEGGDNAMTNDYTFIAVTNEERDEIAEMLRMAALAYDRCEESMRARGLETLRSLYMEQAQRARQHARHLFAA